MIGDWLPDRGTRPDEVVVVGRVDGLSGERGLLADPCTPPHG
jgi:hypothetical protein